MKPYYQRDGITIYHGDCLEIMPQLEQKFDLIFTDPPWPNVTAGMNTNEPYKLMEYFFKILSKIEISRKMILFFGCDSDPRIISTVPKQFTFFNTCLIERIPPFFKGSKFIGADIAYVFGDFKSPTGIGKKVYNQMIGMVSGGQRINDHPAPRNQKTMDKMISIYSHLEEIILDPFLGSGTTLTACAKLNRKGVGIEIEEKYCEIAVMEIEKVLNQTRLDL